MTDALGGCVTRRDDLKVFGQPMRLLVAVASTLFSPAERRRGDFKLTM